MSIADVFPLGVKLVAVAVFAGLFLWLFFFREPSEGPEPIVVTGCYQSIGAPDILVTEGEMVFLQEQPLRRNYRLEYSKGWKFYLEPGVEWVIDAAGEVRFQSGWPSGRILTITREGLRLSDPGTFSISSGAESRSLEYRRSDSGCTGAGA